jgi:hypothetical protein
MPFIGVQPASALLTSADIQDGQIIKAKLANDAVDNTKLDLSSSYDFSAGLTLGDNLTFDVANKGIHLGVTSATSGNLLDDYEEGTFDSTITYDTQLTDTSPDETFSHSGNIYTKIGRFVFYAIKYFDKAGTFSGTAVNVSSVTLPFASINVTNVRPALSNFTPYYISGAYGNDNETSNLYPSVVHSEGSSTATLQMHRPNGGNYMIGMRDSYNVASLYFSGAYFTG